MHTHSHNIRQTTSHRQIQRGVSLVELMVGITIGLLTVAVAMGSILVSRSLSGTVSEVSQLQQQASYAFRVIGQQIRQSGGRVLRPASTATEFGEFDNNPGLNGVLPVSGIATPSNNQFILSLAYQNSMDRSFPLVSGNPVERGLVRNCLGENPGVTAAPVLTSQFRVTNNQLVCAGTGNPQSIISGVTDFQVRYLIQSSTGTTQNFQYLNADEISSNTEWLRVYAVEVCLEISGTERIDTAGTTYIRCDGTSADRGDRLRMVFKNNFYINNHSWNASS